MSAVCAVLTVSEAGRGVPLVDEPCAIICPEILIPMINETKVTQTLDLKLRVFIYFPPIDIVICYMKIMIILSIS